MESDKVGEEVKENGSSYGDFRDKKEFEKDSRPHSRKRKVIYLIFLLLVIILGIFAYLKRKEVATFLTKIGILDLLRNAGILKTSIPGYFMALESQNLLYDYNGDGSVTGEDYPLIMDELAPDTQVGEETVIGGGDTVAASDKLTLPSVRGVGTDAFTGSATTTFPIELPVAPAGLAPSISLNYSSGGVDDLYTGVETKWRNDATHPYQKQAGIVGLGWSLNYGGSVYRDTQGTLNDPSDDTFMISFSGGVADLTKESDDGFYSVWRTAPNLKVRIERWSRCKLYMDTNVCRYHWKATTSNGTKYYFGTTSTADYWQMPYDPDNSYFTQGSGNDWYPLYTSSGNIYTPWILYGSSSFGWHALVTEWKLSKVESIHHIEGTRDVDIEYYYQFEIESYLDKKYINAVYPYKIIYGKNEVEFVREPRLDYKTHQGDNTVVSQPIASRQRIKKILVKTDGKSVRAYVLEYKYGWAPSKHNDINGNGIPDSETEVVSGQVIHSLLDKITPWSEDPQ